MMGDTFSSTVLVTGGSGYLASWVIHALLSLGTTVHTTVRNKLKQAKYAHLLKLESQLPGTLKVFEADLLEPGSFADAMKNCEHVIHTASPFVTSGLTDPMQELVLPACEGTRNVLETVNKTETVEKVVLTSSVVSIYGDACDLQRTSRGVFTENDWNVTSRLDHQPYPYSKVMAEKEAWRIYEAQQDWELAVINPGFILGPSLTDRNDSTSINFMLSMANGTYAQGVPKLDIGIVDVRDVARAHVEAARRPQAKGRHILVSDVKNMWEMAQILKAKFGKKYAFPMMQAPTPAIYILGPAHGLTPEYIRKNVGHPLAFDNRRSKTELGMNYRPVEDTLCEQLNQLVESGLLKKQ